MNVLLTGGTGYLGSHLLAALARDPDHRLTVLVLAGAPRDRIRHLMPRLRCVEVERCDLDALLEEAQVDTIVHCATHYGRGDASRAAMAEANLMLPLRLLDAAVRARRGVVFVNTDTMLDPRVSTYSMSKRQFRDWLQASSGEAACVNVALEHFFGPRDDPTKFVSHLVGALLRGEPSLALTAGEQERDFVYIEDVVAAYAAILRAARGMPPGFVEYQIGRGETTRVRDFVELARALCGNTVTSLDFGALPYRPHEVMRVVADTARVRALGWHPSFTVEQGLRTMIEIERTCQRPT